MGQKTLLVTGIYSIDPVTQAITYKVNLWGQVVPDLPNITLITWFEFTTKIGFDDLMAVCRKKYCEYYAGISQSDIIHLSHLEETTND